MNRKNFLKRGLTVGGLGVVTAAAFVPGLGEDHKERIASYLDNMDEEEWWSVCETAGEAWARTQAGESGRPLSQYERETRDFTFSYYAEIQREIVRRALA